MWHMRLLTRSWDFFTKSSCTYFNKESVEKEDQWIVSCAQVLPKTLAKVSSFACASAKYFFRAFRRSPAAIISHLRLQKTFFDFLVLWFIVSLDVSFKLSEADLLKIRGLNVSLKPSLAEFSADGNGPPIIKTTLWWLDIIYHLWLLCCHLGFPITIVVRLSPPYLFITDHLLLRRWYKFKSTQPEFVRNMVIRHRHTMSFRHIWEVLNLGQANNSIVFTRPRDEGNVSPSDTVAAIPYSGSHMGPVTDLIPSAELTYRIRDNCGGETILSFRWHFHIFRDPNGMP